MANTKIAILIDGGFFIQRHKALYNSMPLKKDVENCIETIIKAVAKLTANESNDVLLRTFYYDCMPFGKEVKHPKGNKKIDFSQSATYKSQCSFINSLKDIDRFALRLGELSFAGWKLDVYKPANPPKPDFRQKGVDMKIGLDMAWMASKKTVDKIVLVTGDSDFISPIKLVRREGILIYLYPMQQKQLKAELKEHCDFIIP